MLLRAVCISAFATAIMSMPAHAARKNSHSAPAASKQVSTRSAQSKTVSGKTAQHHAGGQQKDSRNNPHKAPSRDRQSSHREVGHHSIKESRRSRSRQERSLSSERRERRHYSRRSRYRNYSYHSDYSGADYASNITTNVVSKPVSSPHGYAPRATDIAMTAMSLIGTPYRYGGNSPLTGLDCSGFVKYVYKETLNTDLPRTAAEMSRVGQPVSREELKPGDLVFYNTMRRNNSHVGIYLGDDRFIHSPRTGQRVRINSMNESYWRGRFNGARRIIDGEGIGRAKVLKQYSREADTSPDSYNYDEAPDEIGRAEQSRKHAYNRQHTERLLTDVQKSSDDVVVRKAVSESRKETRQTDRNRQQEIRYQETASRQHRVRYGGEEVHHKDTRHSRTDRDSKTLKETRRHRKDKGQEINRVKDVRHQGARADKRDVGRPGKEKTVDRKKTDKAKAVKSIERKSPSRESQKRKR